MTGRGFFYRWSGVCGMGCDLGIFNQKEANWIRVWRRRWCRMLSGIWRLSGLGIRYRHHGALHDRGKRLGVAVDGMDIRRHHDEAATKFDDASGGA